MKLLSGPRCLPISIYQRMTVVKEQRRLLFVIEVVYMQGLKLTMAGFQRSGAGSKGPPPADAINLFAASGTGHCMTSSFGVRARDQTCGTIGSSMDDSKRRPRVSSYARCGDVASLSDSSALFRLQDVPMDHSRQVMPSHAFRKLSMTTINRSGLRKVAVPLR